jgi:hypothetical protein
MGNRYTNWRAGAPGLSLESVVFFIAARKGQNDRSD